jgi:hypothetical protein
MELCRDCQSAVTVPREGFMAISSAFCFLPLNMFSSVSNGIVTVYTRIFGHMPADV